MKDLYTMTPHERRALGKLLDAARLLAAGLGPRATTTPMGPLSAVMEPVQRWFLTHQQASSQCLQCDRLYDTPQPVRCQTCDTSMCHTCYQQHNCA